MRNSGSILDGKYELLGPLGRGGMGEVYRARHLHLHETRVIKILRRDLAGEPGLAERFLREARIATQIKHPNVAILHDIARLGDGTFYMVWEFVEGVDVAQRLRESGPFEVAMAVELGIHALRGLEAIHTNGVVHRDISPDNLVVRADAKGRPQLKIIDLGLARSLHLPAPTDLEKTEAGVLLGKWRYCSPEQAGASGGVVDLRSDLYSLGAVLYEMVCGLPPFDSETPQGFVLKRLSEEALPLAGRNPQIRVPAALDEVLARSLAREPEDRFPDAVTFIRALVRVADLLRGVSTVEMTVPQIPKPRLTERPRAAERTPPPPRLPAMNLGSASQGASSSSGGMSHSERDDLLAVIERAADRRAARSLESTASGVRDEPPVAGLRDTEALLERYLGERRVALARLALTSLIELDPRHPRAGEYETRLTALAGGADLDREALEMVSSAQAALVRLDLDGARRHIERLAQLESEGAGTGRSAELFAELARAEGSRRLAGEEQQRRDRFRAALEARAFDEAESQIQALERLRAVKVTIDKFRDRLETARRRAQREDFETVHERDFRAHLARSDWAGAREVIRRLQHLVPESAVPASWIVAAGQAEEAHRRQEAIDHGLAQVESFLAAGQPADAELALKILLRLDPANANHKRLEREIEALWERK